MSEYFRVLKRLQAEREQVFGYRPMAEEAEGASQSAPATTTRPAALTEQGRRPYQTLSPVLLSPAYATLYDNLRATANGRPTRSLVFAGACASDPVQAVMAGVAAHVRRLSLRVMVAELVESNGRPLLRSRPGDSDTEVRDVDPLWLDLRSHADADNIKNWVEQNASPADLVLIEGSALAQSIDSALLGCACDGLVLVVRTEVTTRSALHVAVDRARAVGCRPLGIAMYGSKDHLPGWARRLFHHDRRPLAAAEKA
jgi:hypothetical protein